MNSPSSSSVLAFHGYRSSDAGPARRRRLLRIAARVAAVAAALTGLMGALHLPFAAPVLRMIFPGAVCPVMRGSPEQIDRAHALGAAAIRSAAVAPAPARPALGFQLDKTGKGELDAWAASHGVRCGSIAGNENLQRCTGVPATAVGQPADLGPLEEATFEFQSSGQLVNVQTLRRHLTAQQAAHTVAALERSAAAVLGSPTSLGGEPTVAHLSRGLLSTYVATHTFTDYRATVSASNLAETGVMVREEYLSAR
jgi:hypothetical protein